MFALPLLLSTLLANPPVVAEKESSWVGKVVMLKKAGVAIHRSDDGGNEVALAELTELDYRILAERGERVQVKSRNGVAGWLPKSDAVLLADAPGYFTERIQQAPNDSDLFNRRAWAWKLKGEFDIAIKDFSEAIRLNPDAAIFNNRAAAHLAKKSFDAAITDYSEAIRLSPNFALPYYNRGILWETKKDFDKAIDDYSDAIRADPKYVCAYRSRGYMRHVKKEFDKAIDDFSEAIRLDPRDVSAYNDRGNAWHEKKDYDKAVSDFSEAMRIDPAYYYAAYNRGRAFEAIKEFDKAVDDYTEAIRHNPKYLFGYWGRASAHNSLKQHGKAIADYSAALALDPKNARLQNSLAWLLATSPDDKVRDGKRAVELANQAHAADPRNTNVLDTLAAAHAELGEFDDAVRWQERVVDDDKFRGNEGARERLEMYRKREVYRQK